jgi:hypothetical protein
MSALLTADIFFSGISLSLSIRLLDDERLDSFRPSPVCGMLEAARLMCDDVLPREEYTW